MSTPLLRNLKLDLFVLSFAGVHVGGVIACRT